MLPYAEDLDGDRIHVQAPSEIIFLCGGLVSSISEPKPLSLRDAFLKIHCNPVLKGRDLILAEDVTSEVLLFDKYNNILALETDLAQIVELIILFCESEGSLAELGAFAATDEIARRLFVVVRTKYWQAKSFIRLGPLRLLENNYARDSIFVIDDEQVGLRGNSAANVDKDKLKALLEGPLLERLQRVKEPTTFDPTRSGHVIKLVVGLIQEYGALESKEILDLLSSLNVNDRSLQDVGRYLLCASTIGWLKEVARGPRDYFVAAKTNIDAAMLATKRDAKERNKTRRRALIREHWKANDPQRHSAITQVIGGGPL